MLILPAFDKSQISIGKISDIFDPISHGSQSINPHPKCEASSSLFWVDPCIDEDIGMHHSCSENFHPFGHGLLSSFGISVFVSRIYLKSWFYKRKKSWSHPDFYLSFEGSREETGQY